jgi:hypothetical protein
VPLENAPVKMPQSLFLCMMLFERLISSPVKNMPFWFLLMVLPVMMVPSGTKRLMPNPQFSVMTFPLIMTSS